MPISSQKLQQILRGIASTANLLTRTVDEMIRECASNADWSPKASSRSRKRVCLITSESLTTNPRLVKEADALAVAGYEVRVVSCQWMDWTRREDARLLASRNWTSQI